MTTYPADVANAAQRVILAHARDLQAAIDTEERRTAPPDEVMGLVADLLDAHADTGIEMHTWPWALAVVESHLAAGERGLSALRANGIEPWFTVVGTWREGHPEPVVVVPGRRRLDLAIGCWQRQLRSPTPADAVRTALDHLIESPLAAPKE